MYSISYLSDDFYPPLYSARGSRALYACSSYMLAGWLRTDYAASNAPVHSYDDGTDCGILYWIAYQPPINDRCF